MDLSPVAAAVTDVETVAVDESVSPTGRATVGTMVMAETAPPEDPTSRSAAKWLGLLAVVLASVNIFGGFAVTERMLAMYKKKDRPAAKK